MNGYPRVFPVCVWDGNAFPEETTPGIISLIDGLDGVLLSMTRHGRQYPFGIFNATIKLEFVIITEILRC